MSDIDLQPILTGNLVTLRPLTAADFAELFGAAGDPRIWEQHPEPDRYKREVFQKFFDGALESKGAFAIIDLQTNKIIGSSRYYDHKPAGNEICIGYTFLERAYWGKGYNREAKRLMLRHAFGFVRRVLFEVGVGNVRSQKALGNIGAQRVGRIEVAGLDGTPMPCFVYSIDRESSEWTAGFNR